MDKARLEMFLNKLQNYSISGISNSASYDFFVNERYFYSFFFPSVELIIFLLLCKAFACFRVLLSCCGSNHCIDVLNR